MYIYGFIFWFVLDNVYIEYIWMEINMYIMRVFRNGNL